MRVGSALCALELLLGTLGVHPCALGSSLASLRALPGALEVLVGSLVLLFGSSALRVRSWGAPVRFRMLLGDR